MLKKNLIIFFVCILAASLFIFCGCQANTPTSDLTSIDQNEISKPLRGLNPIITIISPVHIITIPENYPYVILIDVQFSSLRQKLFKANATVYVDGVIAKSETLGDSSSYRMTFNYNLNSPGIHEIKALAVNDYFPFSFKTEESVNVTLLKKPPEYFYTSIVGDSNVQSNTPITWAASVSNASGPVSYSWILKSLDMNANFMSSTTDSVTWSIPNIGYNPGRWQIILSVTDGSQTATAIKDVLAYGNYE